MLIGKHPFIFSGTEELVWKWEQSKLCGQSINIILKSSVMPRGHPSNKPDVHGDFISIAEGIVNVQPPARLTNLGSDDYQIGILWTADSADPKIILLGLKGKRQTSRLRASLLRVENYLLGKTGALCYNWSTEYWILDSVVIDSRPIVETDMTMKAMRTRNSNDMTYIYIGLPATTAGPLFNTLISTCNASAACFDYSIGFIWIVAAVDPRNFTIELDKSSNSSSNPVLSMLRQMVGKSWLVEAKLIFKLEKQSRVKAAILAELLGVSQIRLTSTHKPITHS